MEENMKELHAEQMEGASGGAGETIYPPRYCPTHKIETLPKLKTVRLVPGHGMCPVGVYGCPYCDYTYEEILYQDQ